MSDSNRAGFKGLRLHNTLTRAKEDFVPIDPDNVRMYVCGPTVYDFAHIGNARPVIVFDVLYRLLRHLYGAEHVTYVRNITDVDDKINARALRDFGAEIEAGRLSLNEAIRRVTEKTAGQFHKDVAALGCLEPTFEPRATEFVQPRPDGKADMISLIQSLIERGHAYVAPPSTGSGGEVLFDTASMPDYGQLSKRPLDEQQAGARVAVDAHKKNPQDFVLWKLSSPEEPGWDSPWGRGRPGWHIECSAMSAAYLGEVFDIHGGGLDLIFPHHENEIAQSRCAHGTDTMANYWLHNGFLQVEGQKMSKSLGNFYTINELLETEKFGARPWHGGVLRLAMLKTHYRQPIDWTADLLVQCRREMAAFGRAVGRIGVAARFAAEMNVLGRVYLPDPEVIAALNDDLNTPLALSRLHAICSEARSEEAAFNVLATLYFLGLMNPGDFATYSEIGPVRDTSLDIRLAGTDVFEVTERLRVALANNNEKRIDELKDRFNLLGATVEVMPGGVVSLVDREAETSRKKMDEIQKRIDQRLAFIADKNWAEADRIRDELAEQGIQLKDGKDPATGERVTTWEVKR